MLALAQQPCAVQLLLRRKGDGIQRTHFRVATQRYGLLDAATLTVNRHPIARPVRSRRSRLVIAALPVVSGIPVLGPVANLILSPTVLLAAYCIGAVRFWQGYARTTYTGSRETKLGLTLMWPALFVVSKAFRDNFKKAVS